MKRTRSNPSLRSSGSSASLCDTYSKPTPILANNDMMLSPQSDSPVGGCSLKEFMFLNDFKIETARYHERKMHSLEERILDLEIKPLKSPTNEVSAPKTVKRGKSLKWDPTVIDLQKESHYSREMQDSKNDHNQKKALMNSKDETKTSS